MSETTRGTPGCPKCEGGGHQMATEPDEWPLQPLPMVPCDNCRTPFDGAASRMDWQRIYDKGFEDGLKSPCRPKGADAGGLAAAVEAAIIHKFTLGTSLGEHHAAYHRFAVSIAKKVMEIVAPALDAESARAYSQGVEDMRTAAMAALRERDSVEWALGGEYGGADAARIVRDVPIAREGAEPLRRCDVGMSAGPCAKPLNHHGECLPEVDAPAPRGSHMTSEVRSLVKRYGAPAIAAEAARQAKEEER